MSVVQKKSFWTGVYSSFSEVPTSGNVFEESVWATKQASLIQSIRSSSDGASRDYALMYFLAASVSSDKQLRVLDFGGGLGNTYLEAKKVLPAPGLVHFTVVENANVCRLGQEAFVDDPGILFVEEIPFDSRFDFIHFGSSIQYVEKWKELIGTLQSLQAKYIIFSDLLIGTAKSFVTAQSYGGKLIPVLFLNKYEFMNYLNLQSYDCVFDSSFQGAYLRGENCLPMDDIPNELRIALPRQMVFKRR